MKRSRELAIVADGPIKRGDCEVTLGPCTRIRCRLNINSPELLSDNRLLIAGHVIDEETTEREIDAAVDALVELVRTRPTCALDLIDKNASMTLEQIGTTFAVTRERVRQIEAKGLRKLPRGVRALGVQRSDVHEPRLTRFVKERLR